ncbi:MAG: 50S ribosomal protein L9 [Cyanobacteria bacterium J06642_2]
MSKKNVSVVLRQDIPSLGKSGDVVDVTSGYARNYLFPRSLASRTTAGVLKTVELRRQQEEQRLKDEKALAESRKTALETINRYVVKATVGEGEQIFGTITAQDVADVVESVSGIAVDRRGITLDDVKKTGVYPVSIRLHSEVTATIRIQVTPE